MTKGIDYISFTERINNNLISRYSNLDFPPHKTIQLGKYFISGMSPKIQLSIWKLKSSQQSCQNQIWNQMKQISTDRDWSSRGRYSSQYAICFRVGCLAIICRLPREYLRIKIKIFDLYILQFCLVKSTYLHQLNHNLSLLPQNQIQFENISFQIFNIFLCAVFEKQSHFL